MKVKTLDMDLLAVGDRISFGAHAYTNSAGGTSLDKEGSGEIVKKWEDYETGYRFHVRMSNGRTAFVSEFNIIG